MQNYEVCRVFLTKTLDNSTARIGSEKNFKEFDSGTERSSSSRHGSHEKKCQEIYGSLKEIMLSSSDVNQDTILTQIIAAEKVGECVIDFHI